MISQPVISVIMSVYEEPKAWLIDSIESILNQTYSNFEFIIINDKPERIINDEILNYYSQKDERIIIIKNEVNIGLTKSLNKGLNISRGRYIARMDADDISLLNRFKEQLDFMEVNLEVIVCGSKAIFFNDSNEKESNYLKFDNEKIKRSLFVDSCFIHPSVFFRRDVVKDLCLKYDEDCRYAQDYKLWVDLFEFGDFANIPKVLLRYRVSNTQITNRNRKFQMKVVCDTRKLLLRKFINKYISIDESTRFNMCQIRLYLYEIINNHSLSGKEKKDVIYAIYSTYLFSEQKGLLLFMKYLGSFSFLNFSLKENLKFVYYNFIKD